MRLYFANNYTLHCVDTQCISKRYMLRLSIYDGFIIKYIIDEAREARRQSVIAVRIVASIIKILSVKCPNPECDERFIKIAGIMLSGIQINHRGLKSIEYGEAINNGIDSFMNECVKGNGDCTCGMDHGVIGNGQRNSESDHAKLEWVIPSLNVRRVRS